MKSQSSGPKPVFHPSIEGAQHGAKSLDQFLKFAKKSGAKGAQPSSFMLEDRKMGSGFKNVKEIVDAFSKEGLSFDGISAHCPFWVHTTAWTGSPTIRPFIPKGFHRETIQMIENWAEGYILRLLDLCAELGIKVVPMFWGVVFGWEVATGYPWGFWKGGERDSAYDLIEEGKERFLKKTRIIRERADENEIVLCHEIHPGTAAMCAQDFNTLVDICARETSCVKQNADPSHAWEGEGWEERLLKTGQSVYAAHIKNHVIRPGMPLRMMESEWKDRAMQFTDLSTGDINMTRYAETLIRIGYPSRYCELMRTKTAPLVVEAESAYRDLDATSANGVAYVRDHLCFPVASGSFEDGMGDADKGDKKGDAKK